MKKTYVCAQHGIVPANEVMSKFEGRREKRQIAHRHQFNDVQLKGIVCDRKVEVLENMTAGRKVVMTLAIIDQLGNPFRDVCVPVLSLSAKKVLGSVTLGDLTN